MVKTAVPAAVSINTKAATRKLTVDVKHTQMYPVLAVLSTATAFAQAGPIGWGGVLVLGSAVASWLAPAMTRAITAYTMSKLSEALKSHASPATKPSSIAPLPLVPAAASPATKCSPVSNPLFTFSAEIDTPFKAEGGEGPVWLSKLPAGWGAPCVSKTAAVVQLPTGWGVRKAVIQLPAGWGVKVDRTSSSTTVSQGSAEAAPSTPAAAVAVEAAVAPEQAEQAVPMQVKSVAVPSCASSAPGGEAHAAEQVAMLVSPNKRVALAAVCLRLAPEEHRKQPEGLIYSSSDLALAPGGYWCHAGNAERLAKVQGQVQNDFLPASAADDSGLPRVEVSSMADIFKQQWKALRIYATTPSSWPTEGKLVTFGDMQVVAAYGIQG